MDSTGSVIVRTARESDAEALLRLLKRLDDETRLMMYEPGERTTTVREQEELLRAILSSGNGTVLLAEEGGRPVGFLEATGGAFRRNRHVVHLVVGVLKAYAGRGIGTALMEEAEHWACERGRPPAGAHRHDAQPGGRGALREGGLRRRRDQEALHARRRLVR